MKKFLKNYWFILCMLTGIVGGCLVGVVYWAVYLQKERIPGHAVHQHDVLRGGAHGVLLHRLRHRQHEKREARR